MDTNTIFLFPPCRLDVRNEQLWHGTQLLTLRPKTFAVLRVLVAQAGQLVTQDALLDAVWGSMAVSEAVVRSSIRELRTALGDTAQHPQFIQTVHRRGYRFIAPVTVADTPSSIIPHATEAPRGASLSTLAQPEAVASSCTEPSLDEEHKLVTILCCTVTDAPGLAVQRGPEAMHRLLAASGVGGPGAGRRVEDRQRFGSPAALLLTYGLNSGSYSRYLTSSRLSRMISDTSALV